VGRLHRVERLGHGSASNFRAAVRKFASYVDDHCLRAEQASLVRAEPDLAALVREWVRTLPAAAAEGSRRPWLWSQCLRTLMQFHAQGEGAELPERLARFLTASNKVRYGAENELDEFSRQEKQALVRAAWADVRALETRLSHGRALIAAAHGHPADHGWVGPAGLLRALADGTVGFDEARRHIPRMEQWTPELRDLVERNAWLEPRQYWFTVLVALASLLYPRHEDLQAFRVLLVAATGHAPEEITELAVDDVEFTPAGVQLTFTKYRARRIRHREFSAKKTTAAHADSGRLNTPELLRRLLAATEQARATAQPQHRGVFVTGHVRVTGQLVIEPFAPRAPRARFGRWVATHGVRISAPADVRRLRKSVKVEKAIAMRGVVSDIADDHTVQTFLGHYAHGTTLHVLSGQVVNQAQRSWLETAVAGPVLVADDPAAALAEPRTRDAVNLSAQEAEHLISGQLDMGVTSCRDPFASPYSARGDLCSVAPLRCLECRNAVILPSNLPQLLMFAEHLQRLRQRLSPPHFHALWGQSQANLTAAIAERTPAEIATARRQITDQGLALHLPLAATTEFDQRPSSLRWPSCPARSSRPASRSCSPTRCSIRWRFRSSVTPLPGR
jgi:hypothetical protein